MNCISIVVCVHDNDEVFVLAKTTSFSPLCHVNVGEALALFNAIKWLSDMQMDNVDFVVDYKTTNDAFLSNKLGVLEFGHFHIRVLETFIHNSQTLKWSSTGDTNAETHVLAEEVVLSTNFTIYFHMPNCITINEML